MPRRFYQLGETEVHALRGVSLTIHRGEFVAIMGASGSGKSTLMNILGCLDHPTGGDFLLEGINVARLDEPALARIRGRRIGFVFQSFNLLPRTKAIENVELPLFYAAQAAGNAARAGNMLDLLGLADRKENQPNQLSGGQQQRVAIARALVNDPAIVLADEPTGNLDSQTALDIMSTLRALNRQRGVTVVLVTHERDLAEVADRIITIRDGRILSDEATTAAASLEYRELPPIEPYRERSFTGRFDAWAHEAGSLGWMAIVAALRAIAVVEQLFGEFSDPLGATVLIKNVPMTVIGVLARKGHSASGQDQDDVVLIPFTTSQERVLGVSSPNSSQTLANNVFASIGPPPNPFGVLPKLEGFVNTIYIQARSTGLVKSALQEVTLTLEKAHRIKVGQPDDFQVRDLTEIAQVAEQSTRTMEVLLAAIASISLVVGGIGIMNILLVSVTEDFTLPLEVPVSLPSSLVHQRPDILASESQLHSASAAIGVAVAQEFPALNLTGTLSRQSLTTAGLFHHFDSLWGAGGALAAPLFQGGALRAQVRAARDVFAAQAASYQNTVLEALGQVADDLRALGNDADRLKVSQHALAIASESLSLQQISYAAGKTTVLQLIDAERTFAQAKLGFVTAQIEQFQDTADLLVALGGGWWNEGQIAAAR